MSYNSLKLFTFLGETLYLRIGERDNLVNVGNYIGSVCSQFRSHGSVDFVSGNDVNSQENVLILILVSLGMYNKSS